MRTWPLWIAAAFVAAIIVHILTVLLLPPAIMSMAMIRMADAGADAGVVHAPPPDARARTVVRPSPDLAYSICLFDLTKGPLLVKATVPDTYWSVSAFAHNTDNFFVVNDQQLPGDTLELLIKREEDEISGFDGVPVSFAPTDKGVVLMRMLVTDRDSYLKNDTVRRSASCETIPQR
ncbi:DUF1254 domain-containing protein [Pyruvatibacter mobilis]|uniref:DUF1254 domain-containing protein n=1 Tax=Pyruvatibacter mobilis TaxID=1712261 RepID=UPI003BAA516F